MKLTNTFEPLRPLRASGNGSAFGYKVVLGSEYRVDYGNTDWPSRSYWSVPGTLSNE